jgi:nucleoid DNA-binding protein
VKKFDSLIANYLYTNKKVDLEGIGSFSLDDQFVLPPDAEKSAFFPLEGIHFNHDTKLETSPGLIDYIIQHTGKIKSLVQADFSSYVSEVRQFVNIGKPWAIEGIGTLQKNKDGRFELIPGEIIAERVNMNYAVEEEEDDEPVKRRKWMVGFILSIAIIAVVAGIGFGIYVLFIKTQPASVAETDMPMILEDTTSVVQDSVVRRDTVAMNMNDTANYRAIFEVTNLRSRAVTRTTQLNEFNVNALYDSFSRDNAKWYRLFIYKNILPQDTLRVKDSLSVYFGRKVRLEKLR